MKDITYDEIERIKEGLCDGCKAEMYFHELECYKECEYFQKELQEEKEG